MEELHNAKKGKAIEHYIISELLKSNFDVYVPVVDLEGVDMIVRGDKSYVEIQVKSRNIKSPEDEFFIKDFSVSTNFFIVCHNLNTNDFWVMPSCIFNRHCSQKKDKSGRIIKGYSSDKLPDFLKNEEGLRLLKKALVTKQNTIFEKGYIIHLAEIKDGQDKLRIGNKKE
jgi:hypothetical protein